MKQKNPADRLLALWNEIDCSFSTEALARALGAEPCPLSLSIILERCTIEELENLVEHKHDPNFRLCYGARA